MDETETEMEKERADLVVRFNAAVEKLAKQHRVTATLMRDALLDPGDEEQTWEKENSCAMVEHLPIRALRAEVLSAESKLEVELPYYPWASPQRENTSKFQRWIKEARALRPAGYYGPLDGSIPDTPLGISAEGEHFGGREEMIARYAALKAEYTRAEARWAEERKELEQEIEMAKAPRPSQEVVLLREKGELQTRLDIAAYMLRRVMSGDDVPRALLGYALRKCEGGEG